MALEPQPAPLGPQSAHDFLLVCNARTSLVGFWEPYERGEAPLPEWAKSHSTAIRHMFTQTIMAGLLPGIMSTFGIPDVRKALDYYRTAPARVSRADAKRACEALLGEVLRSSLRRFTGDSQMGFLGLVGRPAHRPLRRCRVQKAKFDPARPIVLSVGTDGSAGEASTSAFTALTSRFRDAAGSGNGSARRPCSSSWPFNGYLTSR